jgi:hypothetical protein
MSVPSASFVSIPGSEEAEGQPLRGFPIGCWPGVLEDGIEAEVEHDGEVTTPGEGPKLRSEFGATVQLQQGADECALSPGYAIRMESVPVLVRVGICELDLALMESFVELSLPELEFRG